MQGIPGAQGHSHPVIGIGVRQSVEPRMINFDQWDTKEKRSLQTTLSMTEAKERGLIVEANKQTTQMTAEERAAMRTKKPRTQARTGSTMRLYCWTSPTQGTALRCRSGLHLSVSGVVFHGRTLASIPTLSQSMLHRKFYTMRCFTCVASLPSPLRSVPCLPRSPTTKMKKRPDAFVPHHWPTNIFWPRVISPPTQPPRAALTLAY